MAAERPEPKAERDHGGDQEDNREDVKGTRHARSLSQRPRIGIRDRGIEGARLPDF